MTDLSSKVAIVTGASRGVGKRIALGLCETAEEYEFADIDGKRIQPMSLEET